MDGRASLLSLQGPAQIHGSGSAAPVARLTLPIAPSAAPTPVRTLEASTSTIPTAAAFQHASEYARQATQLDRSATSSAHRLGAAALYRLAAESLDEHGAAITAIHPGKNCAQLAASYLRRARELQRASIKTAQGNTDRTVAINGMPRLGQIHAQTFDDDRPTYTGCQVQPGHPTAKHPAKYFPNLARDRRPGQNTIVVCVPCCEC